jgi:hypothetical protein
VLEMKVSCDELVASAVAPTLTSLLYPP